MRPLLLTSLLLLGGCVVAEPAIVREPAAVVVTVDTFDPYLEPYGAWINVPGYGRVWRPASTYVGAGFYPYGSGGRWLYSDAGWVFESSYPFGWAVFHYGRWMNDPFYGWCWAPSTEWAPAWVSWRVGGPYIGWAPLSLWGAPGFHERMWTFVEADGFMTTNVYAYAVPPGRFHQAVAATQPIAGTMTGPSPTYVSQVTRRPVTAVPLRQVERNAPVPPPPPSQRVARAPSDIAPPPPTPGTLPPPPGRGEERPLPAPPGMPAERPLPTPPGMPDRPLPAPPGMPAERPLPTPPGMPDRPLPAPPGMPAERPAPPSALERREYPRAPTPQQREVEPETMAPPPPGMSRPPPPAPSAPGMRSVPFQQDRERLPGPGISPAPPQPTKKRSSGGPALPPPPPRHVGTPPPMRRR